MTATDTNAVNAAAGRGSAVPRPVAEVIATGPQALIQDRGRLGYQHVGISPAGSFDRMSAARANHVLGNNPDAPLIEFLLGGLVVKILAATSAVVTGFDATITITRGSRTIHTATREVLSLTAGDVVHVGFADYGLRGYFQIRGGFAADTVLGSASYDTLAQIGPRPLAIGDTLMTDGSHAADPNWYPAVKHLPPLWRRVTHEKLTLIPGPHSDWFSAETLANLTSQVFTTTSDLNRIGVRLQAQQPLETIRNEQLPSQGMVRGAIQVPPNGQPVIFGPDHPATGGYPVIGVLSSRACDRLAQLPPGTPVSFTTRTTGTSSR